MFQRLLILILLLNFGCSDTTTNSDAISSRVPEIEGEWWQVTGNPDLGMLTSADQQPVDFGIWQAKDGSWQIWSCIRKTKEEGNTRLFYRWEGKTLEQNDWEPKGIVMRADVEYGETPGGLQAPYVINYEDGYLMFYGDWNRICLAESKDGKHFQRLIRQGSPAIFGDVMETNTRDPMVIHLNNQWYCYYTAHPENDGAIYVRTSRDLFNWGNSRVVSYGGSPGKGKLWFAECPHVVPFSDEELYLFRTFSYGNYQEGKQVALPQTNVYRSGNPFDFGIDSDDKYVCTLPVAATEIIFHQNKWYIASLMPDLKGIRIAKLKWTQSE